VAGTVPLAGRPEFAVADGKGMVFVNIENKNSLTVGLAVVPVDDCVYTKRGRSVVSNSCTVSALCGRDG
jgi:predicted ribosome-associated RNA-binding protein Tma20